VLGGYEYLDVEVFVVDKLLETFFDNFFKGYTSCNKPIYAFK
jgi:hypothetical protein